MSITPGRRPRGTIALMLMQAVNAAKCCARFQLSALVWTNSSGSGTCVRLWAAAQISWTSQVFPLKQLSKAIDARDPEGVGRLYHQHWAPCAKFDDKDIRAHNTEVLSAGSEAIVTIDRLRVIAVSRNKRGK
ncbi:hypothetical protein [Bradyrhizobium sp. BWC-3-1]|uniref:hypothetical protein n=1 Tax=Bradyrhizobium sp. BWC-3-1 TaxID=3080012 RepID=UPI00293F1FE4|nr:hypothetical protein [Bradyrhizobium sp. BWC-3-1]WOH57711.1 hypothetical protein RX329_37105 [Bradyrhizobium sp. BWC-3-1]